MRPSCSECGLDRPLSEIHKEPPNPYWLKQYPAPISGLAVLADETVLVAWGGETFGANPKPVGGLAWLDPITGEEIGERYDATQPIRGGIVLKEGSAIFTQAAMGKLSAGTLVAIDTVTHREKWTPIKFEGAISRTPLVQERRIFVACNDNYLYCYDAVNGQPIGERQFVAVSAGVAPVIIPTAHGPIVGTPETRGRLVQMEKEGAREIARFDDWIRTASAPSSKKLFVVLGGGFYLVNVDRGVHLQKLAEAIDGGVITEHDGWIYFGSQTHFLRVFDLNGKEQWHFEAEGSLKTHLAFEGGLLWFGDTHGKLYLLEANTGLKFGDYSLPPATTLRAPHDPFTTASQVFAEGRVVAGSSGGRVVCLPWHLWHFAKLAAKAPPDLRGELFAAQADFTPNHKSATAYRDEATLAWKINDTLYKAAYMWEACGEWRRAAELYAEAAKDLSGHKWEDSVQLLLRAARLWNKLIWNNTSSGDRDAEQRRDEIYDQLNRTPGVRIPLLRARADPPKFIEHADASFTVRVNNIGLLSAKNVSLTVHGGLVEDQEFVFGDHLPNMIKQHKFRIQPTKSGSLRLDFTYHDYHRRYPEFPTSLILPIEVGQATVIMTGDIGVLKVESQNVVIQGQDIGAVSARGDISKVESEGDIGLVRAAGKKCPECNFVNDVTHDHCIQCGQRLRR